MLSTTVDLLRHGEVAGGRCYRGSSDDPLTEIGWQQMQHKLPESQTWDLIISSPLLRCAAFAQQLAQQRNCPLHSLDALQEIHFGEWEGKKASQIDAALLDLFYANPFEYTPPKGEAFSHFQARVLVAWKTLLQQNQGKRILLITHAGVMRVILTQVLGMNIASIFKLKIDYACLSRIECFYGTETDDFLQLIQHG